VRSHSRRRYGLSMLDRYDEPQCQVGTYL